MKKLLCTFLIAIISILSLAGCKKKQSEEFTGTPEYIISTKYTACDAWLYPGSMYGLAIPFAYTGNPYSDIKLVDVKGEGVENADITLNFDPAKSFNDASYKNYHFGLMGLNVVLKESDVRISEITVEIDEHRKTVHFDKELVYRYYTDDSLAAPFTGVVGISANDKKVSSFYSLTALEEDIEVTGYSVSGNYDAEVICTYTLLDEKQNYTNAVASEDRLHLEVELTKKEDYLFTINNFIVDVKSSDGREGKCYYTFNTSIDAGDTELIEQIIKEIVEN